MSLESRKYNWQGKTFLIAEDDDYSFKFLEVLMKRNNANVIRVTNGVDAFIECIKNTSISLALIDIKMPRLDGYDAVRLIKKYRPDLVCIAETAYASNYEQIRLGRSNFDDFLLKPIVKDELYYTIHKYLRESEAKTAFGSFIYN
jgi:DNA-binding response OmpR family regulator